MYHNLLNSTHFTVMFRSVKHCQLQFYSIFKAKNKVEYCQLLKCKSCHSAGHLLDNKIHRCAHSINIKKNSYHYSSYFQSMRKIRDVISID